MDTSRIAKSLGALLLAIALMAPTAAAAQDATTTPVFKKEELHQLLAPIALYPDDLLANVLVASTYPLEVVQAARWRKEPANAKLKGDALTKALEAKDWDPSVKALTQVPDVLQTMSEKLEWTQKLGDAFLAQEDDVFNEIQFLRQKADQAGSLTSNKQQKVTKSDNYIVVESASPEVVYVPVYEPTVVYGPWWYPDYPPYYWYWGHPASAFVSGFFWGAGFAVAESLWGWGHFDWHDRDIDIDIDRYNKINVNRSQITSNKWQHDPKHRGSVPYRDQASREKFAKTDKRADARKDFRGFDDGSASARVQDKLGAGTADKARDRVDPGGAAQVKDRLGEGGAQKAKEKVSAGGGPQAKDRAGDRTKPKTPDKVTSRDAKKPAARLTPKPAQKAAARPQSSAFDVKRGADVQRHVNRGNVSRQSASFHGGGGGRPSAGRGGGGRGGGGRGGRR